MISSYWGVASNSWEMYFRIQKSVLNCVFQLYSTNIAAVPSLS